MGLVQGDTRSLDYSSYSGSLLGRFIMSRVVGLF